MLLFGSEYLSPSPKIRGFQSKNVQQGFESMQHDPITLQPVCRFWSAVYYSEFDLHLIRGL